MDDMIPVRKSSRLARVFEKGSATAADPDIRRKCAKCPKYELSKLWCPIRAEARHPSATACRYGAVLMGDENQKECRDAKTSS